MKKTYSTLLNAILVTLFNLLFIIVFKNITPSSNADVELLASVISTVASDDTYFEQVAVAQSVLDFTGSDTLQSTVNRLGTFTNPIIPTARQAAQEAINERKSSQSERTINWY